MTWLYAVQFAGPLILVVMMLFLPARNWLGFTFQCLGSAAVRGHRTEAPAFRRYW